jgi:hypothetical protein
MSENINKVYDATQYRPGFVYGWLRLPTIRAGGLAEVQFVYGEWSTYVYEVATWLKA